MSGQPNLSIDELSKSLKEAWDQDQRVKALKIVIQCSKCLDDFSNVESYPNKFTQITDILDNFGQLVFQRISSKSKGIEMDIAQETCKNWFYKVASIRELIPRFYVECSILHIYQFISDKPNHEDMFEEVLLRLSKTVRGIGNPLIALNARSYLCRVAMRLVPGRRAVIVQNFKDFFLNYAQISPEYAKEVLADQSVKFSTYLTLFTPPLNSVFEHLERKTPESLLSEYLNEITDREDLNKNLSVFALVLNSVFSNFRASFIVAKAALLLDIVKKITSDAKCAFPIATLLQNMGNSFVAGSYSSWQVYDESFKLTLLNDVWKMIGKLPLEDYIACADVWIDFVVQQFGPNEINIILKDIVKHALRHTAIEKSYDRLLSIIKKVALGKSIDFTTVIIMDGLMPFLDLLQKEEVKVEACKLVLGAFLERRKNYADLSTAGGSGDAQSATMTDPLTTIATNTTQSTFIDPLAGSLVNLQPAFSDPLSSGKSLANRSLSTAKTPEVTSKSDPLGADIVNNLFQSIDEEEMTISDPVILNAVNNLCKTMHDAINALTLEDDRRQISKLIVDYLSLVSYDDLEAHLSFLVESRANYFNLDTVTSFLIFSVNKLAMKAKEHSQDSRKHHSFIKACVAYAFITIPSLDDYVTRLQLYLLSAQVALASNCLSQADALLRAAIVLLSQLPQMIDLPDNKSYSAEPFFTTYVSSMLSFLIIVPDNPDQEPLYLIRGLFNTTKGRNFEDPDRKVQLYLNFISYAKAASQSKYSYGLENVESNDAFYGQSEPFLAILRQLSDEALEEVLTHISNLGEQQKSKRQATLAIDCFCYIVSCGDIKTMSKLAIKLWNVARKSATIERKQLDKVYNFIVAKSTSSKDNAYNDLAMKIKASLTTSQ